MFAGDHVYLLLLFFVFKCLFSFAGKNLIAQMKAAGKKEAEKGTSSFSFITGRNLYFVPWMYREGHASQHSEVEKERNEGQNRPFEIVLVNSTFRGIDGSNRGFRRRSS